MHVQKNKKIVELIKSLSTQETAYINRILGSYKKESKSKQLFNAIRKQKTYNEPELYYLIYEKKVYTKKFMVLKTQLFKLILDNMVAFRASNSIDNKLRSLLSAVDFLYSKQLYNLCYDKLEEAKELAMMYEKHLFLVQINQIEQVLEFANFNLNRLKMISGTYLFEQSKLLKKEANYQQYVNIESRLFYLMYSSAESIPGKLTVKQLKEVLSSPLMRTESAAISFEAKVIFHNIWCSFNFFIKKFPTAYLHATNLVTCLETLKADGDYKTQKRYMLALSNLLLCQIFLIKQDEFTITISKLKKLQNDCPALRATIFINVMSSEIEMYTITGSIEEGLKLIPEIEKGLKYYKGKVRNYQETVLFLQISIFLFTASDYRHALKWINRVLNYEAINPHDEAIVPAKILNLLIHYELGNLEMLEYILKSVTITVRKNQKSYPVELCILRYLKGLTVVRSKSELINTFKNIKTALISLTGNDKLIEWKSIEYLYLVPWLESKIQNRPMIEIMKEKSLKVGKV